MENWINVCEYDKKSKEMMEWLFKLLEEEQIPYKEELQEEWIGVGKYAKYKATIIVFVPKEYKEKVESYISEYNNPNNIVYEEAEELRNASIDEDEEYKLTRISNKVIWGVFIGMMLFVTVGIMISSFM